MNPNGSFGNGQITPELAQAIQSRQGSQTQAVTSSAPSYDPTTQPSTAQPSGLPMPPPQPMPFSPVSGQQAPSQAPTQDAGMGMPVTPESSIILKALDSRLKSISKQEESQVINKQDEMKLGGGM